MGKFLAAWAGGGGPGPDPAPPITVSLLGPLDWGPVLGAYLATLLLAAAYIAIGLFVSARTDNQIVEPDRLTAVVGASSSCWAPRP
jgi:ABC-2 type transport system permease protein